MFDSSAGSAIAAATVRSISELAEDSGRGKGEPEKERRSLTRS